MTTSTATIGTLGSAELEQDLGQLAALLHACVHAGASIGFIVPLTLEDAEKF